MIARSRRPTGVAGTTPRSRWICSPLSPRAAPAVTFGRSSAPQGLMETNYNIIMDFDDIKGTIRIKHEHGHGHVSTFPTRTDYLSFFGARGLSQGEVLSDIDLVQSIYLDWLRRGQVGCVFAQLLARPPNRAHVRTLIMSDSAAEPNTSLALAKKVDSAFRDAVQSEAVEALTILMPQLIRPEALVYLIKSLGELPEWKLESILPWRDTITVVGVRALIEASEERPTWAELLGMGPFPTFLPPTRQCPITSLEIRTKGRRSIKNKINPDATAGHLAALPAELFIGRRDFKNLFEKFTPALKLRILGGTRDDRGKASVTFSVPTAIWYGPSMAS